MIRLCHKILKIVIIHFIKFIHCRKNVVVIFQNDEDKKIFVDNKIISKDQAYKIMGSGVDLSVYQYTSEPDDDIVRILFTARMLRDKGVMELVDAANLLKAKYHNKICFLLCGDVDNNPRSLTRTDLENITDGEYIKWLGYRNDILELLMGSHIFAFPSYYREGLPKSLIEACAIGRPIITTNSIGCKDCVIDNYNGFLIPTKNSRVLADKLAVLIDNRPLRVSMGKNSRVLAERYFSVATVIEKHIEIYDKLLQ